MRIETSGAVRRGLCMSEISAARRERSDGEARQGPPRTDTGTILIHWGTAIAFLVSLFTGLRIASDAPDAVVSKWLTPILPQGEIWTWHFAAGLTLFFFGSAYILYLRRSGLSRRVNAKKLRVFALPAATKLKFGALNVALYWLLYALVAVLTGTGILLYLGHGGWLVWVHSTAAFISIAYIAAHLVSHFLYGGVPQLLRVFRPAALVATKTMRPLPLAVGIGAGVVIAGSIAALDLTTRDQLTVAKAAAAPKIDGVLDDAVWAQAQPVKIRTQQGANLGGTGESTVEVRAVHDGERIYFAFKWEDPSRSLRRIPMIKKEDGWHLLHDNADIADVITFYEDKLSIVFAETDAFGGGGATHMGERPLSDKPKPLHARGYHYTADGSMIDMWQWKASRGGHLGRVDDQYIGPPRTPTEGEAAGKARYQAGYWNDPGRAFYVYNYKGEPPGGYRGPVQVLRLPTDWKAVVAAMGKFDLDPDSSNEDGSKWWMMENETAPYSPELDAAIPVGTVLPGVLIMGDYEGDRADVTGAAKWRDGYWTLEATRKLATGSEYDKDFVPGKPLYMWVSVFDHTQTRHTRHARPVRIDVQN